MKNDYVLRMIEEKKELDAKIEKLVPFVQGKIFKTLPKAKQHLLSKQLNIMESYSLILEKRLALEEVAPEPEDAGTVKEPSKEA